jgi:hypothetical protein
MPECKHEIDIATCGDCTPRHGAEPATVGPRRSGYGRGTLGPWFTASLDGDCSGPCGGEIWEGDRIRSDGEGGWLCSDCGRDAEDDERVPRLW